MSKIMNWKNFFNPFLKYSERQLFLVGILGMVATIAASFYTKTQIRGIFRLEPSQKIGLPATAENCVAAYAAAILFLFILGKIFNKKTRLIDMVNTVLLSQILNFVIIVISSLSKLGEVAKTAGVNRLPIAQYLHLLVSALFILPLMIYSFVLFYNGFRTATNIKKWQQITVFCFATFLFIIIYQTISQFINI